MEQSNLLDAYVQAKRIYNLLTEVQNLSNQLAEAMDRNDEVTIRMLLAMRGEPIDKLRLARRTLDQQCSSLGEEDGRRLTQLLKGEGAETKEEAALAEQVAANGRLLKQVIEVDRRLNTKLTREKSVYKNISPETG